MRVPFLFEIAAMILNRLQIANINKRATIDRRLMGIEPDRLKRRCV